VWVLPTKYHAPPPNPQPDALQASPRVSLRIVRQFDRDAFSTEVDVPPPLVVRRDSFHGADDPIAHDEGADVDSGIRDVLLQAHDLAEELQGVDDRRGLLEALHAHHADPLRPREDFQDSWVADQMRGLHEVRPGGQEDAPRDRDARLPERLERPELGAR